MTRRNTICVCIYIYHACAVLYNETETNELIIYDDTRFKKSRVRRAIKSS